MVKKSGKLELLGKTLQDEARVVEVNGVFWDGFLPILRLQWDKEMEKNLPGVVEKVTPKFEYLEKFYGEKEFALGYLTIADFKIVEFSHWIEKVAPEIYKKFGFLKRVGDAFHSLPEIKKYYEKERAVKGPFVIASANIQI